MPYKDVFEEIKLLNHFSADLTASGIKVHEQDAAPEFVAAAERLFNKGLTDHIDGGYLTERGIEAAQMTHKLLKLLSE